MVLDTDIFNTTEYLDPHCPNCNAKIEYGVTTQYSDDHETHVCLGCQKPL